MTTPTDITNRALQLLGTRTNVASLAEQSNEAFQANLSYLPIRDWCLGLENWNFARRTLALTLLKTAANPAVPPWTSAQPSPPWLYEYQYPADGLIIRYVTNALVSSTGTFFLGEPQRFAAAVDTIATVDHSVILTNTANAIAIYTAQMIDPTVWPWYFERFMVDTFASTLCMALTGDEALLKFLDNKALQSMQIAMEANVAEGLRMGDTTPEWIQALGINYPFRRDDGKAKPNQDRQQDGNRR